MSQNVKETPIIFSGDSVRAILEGRKTQTRRVMKPAPTLTGSTWTWKNCSWTDLGRIPVGSLDRPLDFCPYGNIGDRLWVKESFYMESNLWARTDEPNLKIHYACDVEREYLGGYVLKRSIFMPRWASRITLEITGLRVERLQDISVNDCYCEGVQIAGTDDDNSIRRSFQRRWDSVNAKRGFGWTANPWVWVIRFNRVPDQNAR